MRLINNHLRIFLVAFVLTFAVNFSVFGQNCNPDEIINLPGVYKGPGKGSVSGIAKADLEKQQAITQIFTKMVMDNYKPKGMNISYGKAHFSPPYYNPNGLNTGNHYNANFFLKYFYCNHENKMEEIAETHSIIEFEVNGWKYESSFFVRASADDEDAETDVFGTIKHKPVWNEAGYWTMTDTIYSGRDLTHFHYIVTKNRELPFVYMTKKEFLEKLRKYYQKQIEVTVNTWKNPTSEEAEYARERIEGDKLFYGKSIQNIDDFLNNSPEKILNEPAKITGGGPSSEFESFPEGKYASWVIKPNPDYYNPKAPKYTPHFIDVHFTIYEPQVACLNAKNDILKIIDFKSLQEIVDNGGVPVTPGTPSAKPTTNTIKK
jgi:hypothetical protein